MLEESSELASGPVEAGTCEVGRVGAEEPRASKGRVLLHSLFEGC